MELLVATWTLRIAIIAALAVGGVSYQAGASAVDCVDRALAVAVVFTLAGRFLMNWLEPPERKMLRMRKRREAKRSKAMKSATSDTVAAARARRSASTISKSA
jgi:flagellar motor component MotA